MAVAPPNKQPYKQALFYLKEYPRVKGLGSSIRPDDRSFLRMQRSEQFYMHTYSS